MILNSETTEFVFSLFMLLTAFFIVLQLRAFWNSKRLYGSVLFSFVGLVLVSVLATSIGFIHHDSLLTVVSCMTTLIYLFITIVAFKKRRAIKKKSVAYQVELKEILWQLPGYVYWKDRYGKFVGSNKNNLKNFGFSSNEDFYGKTDYSVMSKMEADLVRAIDSEVIRTGKSLIREELCTLASGVPQVLLSQKSPLKNEHGETVGLLGVSIDITESKKTMLDRLAMLEDIIAVMPGHVYWIDREGKYLGCNDNQARAAGLTSRKDIVGKTNSELPWNESSDADPEEIDRVNSEVMSSGQSISLEEKAILENGEEAVFLSNKAPLRNSENDVIGMVGVSMNITRLKKIEKELVLSKQEAESADQAKSQFIENMEHDIRTPFVGVYGMVQLLLMEEDNAEKKSMLEDVSSCAKELMDYCDSILDFSKVDSGLLPQSAKCFELKTLLARVVAMQSLPAKSKGLSFNFEYDDQLPAVIKGDQYRLNRILINLIGNAVKFTQEGQVNFKVHLVKKDLETRQMVICFTVEDTGIGIAEEKQAAIFDRFVKATPSNKGHYHGYGLGLTIVNQFVEDMGGDVHLKSKLGEGSAFIVFLPFKIPLSDEILDA